MDSSKKGKLDPKGAPRSSTRKRRHGNEGSRTATSNKEIKIASEAGEPEYSSRFTPIERAPSFDVNAVDCSPEDHDDDIEVKLSSGSLCSSQESHLEPPRSSTDWQLQNTKAYETRNSQLAVDQASFKEAEALIQEIAAAILMIVVSFRVRGYYEPAVESLTKRLEAAGCLAAGEHLNRSAGAVGLTGAGKSKMIGCLVDEPDAVKTSGTGESGTDTIWEYAMKTPEMTTKFRVEVVFRTPQRIKHLIAEACAECFRFRQLKGKDVGSREYEEAEKDRDYAVQFLATLTVDLKGTIHTKEKLEKLLAELNSENDEDVTDIIFLEVNSYLDCIGRKDSKTTIDGDDIKRLRDEARTYAGPNRDPETNDLVRSPWQVVERIRVYLDAPILADGLVLMDLPGTGDSDRMRMETAHENAAECQIQLICGAIERFTNQDIIDRDIRDRIRTGKISSCVLVATKIDLMDHEQASSFSPAENKHIRNLRKRADRLKDELDALEEALGDAKEDAAEIHLADGESASCPSVVVDLIKQCEAKRHEVDVARAEANESNILARNNFVRSIMWDRVEEMIGKMGGGSPPRMFFLSSDEYLRHLRSRPSKRAKLDLNLWRTGIGQLRQYLREAPAEMRHDRLKWVFNEFQKLLIGLDLHCSKTRLELKREVMSRLEGPAEQVRLSIVEAIGDLKCNFANTITSLVKDRESQWNGNARQLFEQWNKIHNSSLGRICVKLGRHVSSIGHSWDFGETILRNMDQELVAAFVALDEAVDQASEQLLGVMYTALDEIKNLLRGILTNLRACGEAYANADTQIHLMFWPWKPWIKTCSRSTRR